MELTEHHLFSSILHSMCVFDSFFSLCRDVVSHWYCVQHVYILHVLTLQISRCTLSIPTVLASGVVANAKLCAFCIRFTCTAAAVWQATYLMLSPLLTYLSALPFLPSDSIRTTFKVDPDSHLEALDTAKQLNMEGTSKWSAKIAVTGMLHNNVVIMDWIDEAFRRPQLSSFNSTCQFGRTSQGVWPRASRRKAL